MNQSPLIAFPFPITSASNALNIPDYIKVTTSLFAAYENAKNDMEKIECLQLCSLTYFRQKKYIEAAKLILSALVYYDTIQNEEPSTKVGMQYRLYTLESLEDEQRKKCLDLYLEIETAFINTTLQKQPWGNDAKTWMEDRNTLIYLRMTLQKMIQNPKKSSQSLMEFTTQSFKELGKILIERGIKILGKPPCLLTFISLGSMSQFQMAPFSDFEFAILFVEDNATIRKYVQDLVNYLTLKFISLGETPCNIEGLLISPPYPRKGFSLDSIIPTSLALFANTPINLAGYLKTPDRDILICNSLRTVGYMVSLP